MQYNRKNMSSLNGTQFEAGVHCARITEVAGKYSKKNKPMFVLTLSGTNQEKAYSYFVFETEMTERNMNRLLASIEDNGQAIPSLDFDYNQETATFLNKKRVFIKVRERTGTYTDQNGEIKDASGTEIQAFLSSDEYAKEKGTAETAHTYQKPLPQITQRQSDPFANSKPIEISDDDLPF